MRCEKPRVGDLRKVGEELYEISSVTPILTPYRHAGQTTSCEGYTLGLLRLVPWVEVQHALLQFARALAGAVVSDDSGGPKDGAVDRD